MTSKLNINTFNADSNGLFVSSVIVSGETEAVLINGQFTLADAHEVVAQILRIGKKLTTVYVSHGDPDFYFGLQVIKQAFPNVKVYSSPKTLAHIENTLQKKLETWGPRLGMNGPTNIVMPELLPSDTLTVDGETLKIVGLDGPSPERTFVWIPTLKAVVGGVVIYGNLHLWMADAPTAEARQAWIDILDNIFALNPEIVIPGHAAKDAPNTVESVQFSRDYIEAFSAEVEKANISEELNKAMLALYPDAQLQIALDIGAKVSMGEMTW